MIDARPWLEWWHRVGHAQVRAKLWTQWDPLDLAEDSDWPRDEYESHEHVLGSKLRRGDPTDEIATYLAETLGPDRTSAAWNAQCATLAGDLVTWYRESGAPA